MKARDVLREDHPKSFITELYDGDLHAKRVLSLAHGTLGVLSGASLAVHAIGQGSAHARGTLSKHGVKQVDRLLSNTGVDMDEFFSHWVPHEPKGSVSMKAGQLHDSLDVSIASA